MFRRSSVWTAAGLLFLIVVYGFDVGHGFVKDDFGWILTSRVTGPGDLRQLTGAPTGFFRPIVSLSFAATYALFGARPIAYGLTNLALLLVCVLVLIPMLRAAGLGRGVAVGAGLVWGLNFQGIAMAVLWISGRTALLVTLFSILTAWAWIRDRRLIATLLAVTAMCSKEEAFALPAILTAWSMIDAPRSMVHAVRRSWPLWLAAAVSLLARSYSGAYTPGSAPPFYRYQFDVTRLAENVFAYADRVGTTLALALLIFWLAAGVPGLSSLWAQERLSRPDWRPILKGAVWTALSLMPTILLPVRSSLYAVLPSVGVALMAGHLAERVAEHAAPRALRRAALVLALIFVGLLPVYRLRNARYVNEAELSAAIVAELARIGGEHPDGGLVVIEDRRDVRPTAEQALGPLADRAAELAANARIRAWIDPAPVELAGVSPPDLARVATLVVEKGEVRRAK